VSVINFVLHDNLFIISVGTLIPSYHISTTIVLEHRDMNWMETSF
jgi:hypothetical protein